MPDPDSAAPDDLDVNPDWLLDRVDAAHGRAWFVRSDRQRLIDTLFLDGRTPFADGQPACVDFDQLIGTAALGAKVQIRLVMHMSFCGSTQLAHLLAASGAATLLKEPHALVDLADWHRSLAEQGVADDRLAPVLGSALRLLSREWPGAGPTVIKPSNWANSLMPALARRDFDIRAILIVIDRRAFLRAAFRGGRDRLAFTARAAAHFAGAMSQTDCLAAAVIGVTDPLDQVARLALIAHHFQRQLFDAAIAAFARTLVIDYSLIRDDPRAALSGAVEALGLIATDAAIGRAVEERQAMDAKQPGEAFSATAQGNEDGAVEQHHAARFDAAVAWADANLLPASEP